MSKLALVMLLFAGSALAQSRPRPQEAARPQHYDFDDDVVEGGTLTPDGSLIQSRKGIKHSSLIKIRENFQPELLKSAEDQ